MPHQIPEKSIFYDFHDLLSHNVLFNFVIGNRGAGKTYGFKKWAIKSFLKTGSQFIYLRRYKTEFDDFKNFFADISHEFPDVTFEVKGKLLYINGELAGYGIALSTALTSDIDNPSNGIIRTPTQFINGLIDDLTINQVKNDGNLIARLNGLDNTQNVSFDFSSGGKSRWRFVKTTGADEGLFIFSYNDDGTFKEEVLSLHRGSGKARFMKDIDFLNAFTGSVVTTPDGTKKYRIGVDNNGTLTTTLIN